MGLKARVITVAFGGLDEGLLWGDLVSKRESWFKACWGKGGRTYNTVVVDEPRWGLRRERGMEGRVGERKEEGLAVKREEGGGSLG